MLNNELYKITNKTQEQNPVRDKLVELYCSEKNCAMIFLRLAVRYNYFKGFGKRMLYYRTRLYHVYRKTIASLAILIDDNPDWRPKNFKVSFWDSTVQMEFPIIKILDFKSQIAELEASHNHFATIILAQLITLEKISPKDKLAKKIGLTRLIFKKGWKQKDIRQLLNFIDWLITLPNEHDAEYEKSTQAIEEETNMRPTTTWERVYTKRGLERGQGSMLLKLLNRKFNTVPKAIEAKILTANSDALMLWAERLLESPTLEGVFAEV